MNAHVFFSFFLIISITHDVVLAKCKRCETKEKETRSLAYNFIHLSQFGILTQFMASVEQVFIALRVEFGRV